MLLTELYRVVSCNVVGEVDREGLSRRDWLGATGYTEKRMWVGVRSVKRCEKGWVTECYCRLTSRR